jgi:hypothetical protein
LATFGEAFLALVLPDARAALLPAATRLNRVNASFEALQIATQKRQKKEVR